MYLSEPGSDSTVSKTMERLVLETLLWAENLKKRIKKLYLLPFLRFRWNTHTYAHTDCALIIVMIYCQMRQSNTLLQSVALQVNELWNAGGELCNSLSLQRSTSNSSSTLSATAATNSALLPTLHLVGTYLRWSATFFDIIMAMSYAEDYFCNWPTPDDGASYLPRTYNSPGKLVDLRTCSVYGVPRAYE